MRLIPHQQIAAKLAEADRLLTDGKGSEALPLYLEAIESGTSSFALYHNAGVAALETDPHLAEDLLRMALTKRENPGTHQHLATALALQGKFDESIPHFRRAVEMDPGFAKLSHPQAAYTYQPRPDIVADQVCPLCMNSAAETVFAGNSSRSHATYGVVDPIKIWVRCHTCGLIYANPRPSYIYLREYYRQSHLHEGEGKQLVDSAWTLISLDYERMETIEKLRGDRTGTILDVGSGPGFFLAVAKDRGWQVTGIDISAPAASYARKTFGLDVIEGSFDDIEFPDSIRFDVITLWETIEHLYDPLEALNKVHNLLGDDGIVAIWNTERRTSLSFGPRVQRPDVGRAKPSHLLFPGNSYQGPARRRLQPRVVQEFQAILGQHGNLRT